MNAVLLRPWRDSDVPELARLANNRRVWAQLRDAFPHPYTEEAGRAWVAFANSQSPVTNLAVEHRGALVGGIGYIPGQDVERCSAEVGYRIGESYWGRGLATTALVALTEVATRRGGFTRLFALPFATNVASRRLLKKAGFALDAVLTLLDVSACRIPHSPFYRRRFSSGESIAGHVEQLGDGGLAGFLARGLNLPRKNGSDSRG